MGSYNWGYKSPNMGYIYSYPTYITLLITTHEPPSKAVRSRVWGFESRELNWGLGFGAVRNLGFNVGT